MVFATYKPAYVQTKMSKEDLAHILYEVCQNRTINFEQVKEQLQNKLVYKLSGRVIESAKAYRDTGTGLTEFVEIVYNELFPTLSVYNNVIPPLKL